MATPESFLHAGFLHQLEQFVAGAAQPPSWPPALAEMLLTRSHPGPSTAASQLIQLLRAYQAVMKAAFDTAQVANELRRYQKFVKPGRPSPHIVQLRQQQAAARQASSQSRQALIQAAAAFVREAGIEVPTRLALEPFIKQWMDTRLPNESADAGANLTD